MAAKVSKSSSKKPNKNKKNKKTFSDSNRKSSQRSSSNDASKTSSVGSSSKSSASLKSSASSKIASELSARNRNNRKSENCDTDTFKTIYKGAEESEKNKELSSFTTTTLSGLQGTICIYTMVAIIYQLIWGKDDGTWFDLFLVSLFEHLGVFALMAVTHRPFIGYVCMFLSYHYVNLFMLFSLFLHSSSNSKRPFFERIFGLASVCFAASAIHFFIVLLSMKFVGESRKRKDYSEKVIVEGVEKRRKDLYVMISDLISEICYDDKELQLNLTIRDETGHPKSMRGAGVEAGVNRVLEMSTDGQRVNLSTSNTTLTRIDVPKHKHHHHHQHHKKGRDLQKDLAPIIDSKYNNCSKQEKMLSPRKILK